MKKQLKTNWQAIVFAAIGVVVLMFAASSQAVAQKYKPGTVVYPVKATYTVKTFYRKATEVSEGWVRILNFYVNAFGEWQIGSEETIKGGKTKRIPKN